MTAPSNVEINARISMVADAAGVLDVGLWKDGVLRIGDGYFTASVLRNLANAIDGFEEATAAAMEDLKQDSPAYQRGVEDGKNWFSRKLALAIMEQKVAVLTADRNWREGKVTDVMEPANYITIEDAKTFHKTLETL